MRLLTRIVIAGWQFFLLPNSDAIRGGLPFVLINLVFGFALGRWAAVSLSLVIVVLAIPFFDQTYGEGTSIGGVIVFAAVCAAVLLGIGVLARLAIDRLRTQG
jgi:hypothetical protein